ncbi:putative Ig domain-containing protein [Marivivens aquimaris]|uniref:putative Ig domain-containing protein n=1 Tax=Marivivens aquimaris TaxID=2774876 RepID=UPI0018815C50|nr:putative Ig domain-containing protein [Marivivens aquimaris]
MSVLSRAFSRLALAALTVLPMSVSAANLGTIDISDAVDFGSKLTLGSVNVGDTFTVTDSMGYCYDLNAGFTYSLSQSGIQCMSTTTVTFTSAGGASSLFDNMWMVTVAEWTAITSGTDSDGNLTAAGTVTEPVGLDTTIDTTGEAVDIFDFTIRDGGSSDGQSMDISQIVLNVTGTSTDADRGNITFRLNGPDASNVTGTCNSGSDTITFSGLSISVANGASETYTVNAFYNDNSAVTEDRTVILSVDGDTDVTVSNGTAFGSTSAVTNGTGTTLDVTATKHVFTTQPAGSTSGATLATQPVVTAQDAFGNTDVAYTGTVTLSLSSGSGSLSGTAKSAVNGVATFTDIAYTATADQESFALTTDGASSSGLSVSPSNAVTSDVVATKLVFTTEPAPTSITSAASTSFTTVPVVKAVDANSTVDTGYSTDIVLSVTDPNDGTIDGTVNSLTGTGDADGSGTTVTITPASGSSTFTGLTVQYTNDSLASNTIALRATSGGLTSANSTSINSTNIYPVVVTSLSDQTATAYTAFSYQFPSGSFSDADGTIASYAAVEQGQASLPSWLSFNSGTRTFSGTPANADGGTVTIEVTATDNSGGTVSDAFDIIVGTTPQTLDVNGAALSFAGTGTGTGTSLNSTRTYSNVITIGTEQVDATVTLTALSNATVSTFDSTANPYSETHFFQPNISVSSPGGYATFKFEFFDAGGVPVTLQNVYINTYDLDGAGASSSGRQYTDFTNIDAYALSSTSDVTTTVPSAGVTRFVTTVGGNITAATGSDEFNDIRARVFYDEFSSISISVGDTSATGVAYYGLDFSIGYPFGNVGTSVAANVAPTVSGNYNGTGLTEGDTSTAITVASLLSQVTSGDADGDTLGIAITNISGSANGWQYSFDNSSWSSVSTVSDSSALLLDENAYLRVVTDSDNGASYMLTFRAWDQTTGTASTALSINTTNVSTNGGTTAFSSGTGTYTIVAADANDAPALSVALVDQSVTALQTLTYQFAAGSFTDVDTGDVLTYTATLTSGGSLPSWLSFDASTRTFSGTPQDADVGTISVRVTATDTGSLTATDDFDIVVNARPDSTAPTVTAGQTLTYDENQADGAIIGTVAATDNIAVTGFKFQGSNSATSVDGSFTIDSAGNVTLNTGPVPAANDYETTPNTITYAVQAWDAANNLSVAVDVTFAVADLDEVAPAIIFDTTTYANAAAVATSIYERETAVGQFTSDETVTWSLGGTDGSLFAIDTSGNLTFVSAPDYETPIDQGDTANNNTYVVEITAADASTNQTMVAVTVTVLDVDEDGPVLTITGYGAVNANTIELSRPENSAVSIEVTSDRTATWAISGTDASLFTMSNGTVTMNAVPDYEAPTDSDTNNVYEFTVTATNIYGADTAFLLKLTITDLDDTLPLVGYDGGSNTNADGATIAVSVNENQTGVTDLTASEAVTWAITGAHDGALFAISSAGEVTFVSAPDYETPLDSFGTAEDNVYALEVTATDTSSNVTTITVEVTVLDLDDISPVISLGGATASNGMDFQIDENETDVTSVTTDETATITISGTDGALFAISGGRLVFLTAPDYDNPSDNGADNVYDLVITAEDAAGNTSTVTITVTVLNLADSLPGIIESDMTDNDGDGINDAHESMTADRDGDGIMDADDYDPEGYFYCEDDGRILTGGGIVVTGPAGSNSTVGTQNNIRIELDGSDGRYQWFVTQPGTYTMDIVYPSDYPTAGALASSGTLDLTTLLPDDPASLGSSEYGSTGYLADSTPTAFYTVFDIEAGDPVVIGNNLPVADCGVNTVTLTGPANIDEPTSGTTDLTFTVSQSRVSAVDTMIAYTMSGTATSGSDYTAPSGTVTIAAGDTSADITITVQSDTLSEADETVILTLASITSSDDATALSSVSANLTASVTIAESLIDAIRDDLTAVLQDDFSQTIQEQQDRFDGIAKGALDRLKEGQDHLRCGVNEAFDVSGMAEVVNGEFNTNGSFREDVFNCMSEERIITEGDFEVHYAEDYGTALTLNYTRLHERMTTEDDLRGWFYGGYVRQAQIDTGNVDGIIRGFGVNGGLYGASRLNETLFIDYYGALAVGRHNYTLDFESQQANAAGEYTYSALFGGVALSGETEFETFTLVPRVGIDTAHARAGSTEVTVTSLGLSEVGDLDIGDYDGSTLFGELIYQTGGYDAEADAFTRIEIAPRVSCSLGASATCGAGAYIDYRYATRGDDIAYGLRLDYEVMDERDSFTLDVSRSRLIMDGQGTSGVNLTTDQNGNVSVGVTLEANY